LGEVADANILICFTLKMITLRKVEDELYYYFFVWLNSPTRALASSFLVSG